MDKKVRFVLAAMMAVLGMGLAACRPSRVSDAPLRIAVLPILDALPLYVADAEGFFADEGINVTFVPAGSAAERDQLLQAGQVDGVITDLVALALYNRESRQIVATRYAMVPTPQSAQFRILASGASGFTSPADLRNIPVGVSEGTVIEYVTDRLLAAEGLKPSEIETLAVPRIPERMALLGAGELQAATLPEPLGSLALQQGATLVVDDTAHPELSCSLLAFRADVLESRTEAVRRFLAAADRASVEINADKSRWSDLLTERQLVPAPLEGSYTLPNYPTAATPTRSQFEDVVAWLMATERLEVAPKYEDVVDATYLE